MAKKWNVLVGVVHLITAETAEEAIKDLQVRLSTAGFEVYEGQEPNAFESEPDA